MHNDTEKDISEVAREEKLTELDILKQSLEDKQRKTDEYYDQLLRLKAEYENFRIRSEREKRNHLDWGKEDILLKQIGLLDVLEQASESVKTSDNIESIKQGLELIKLEFIKMLKAEGLSEMDCSNAKFDPLMHEAIDIVEGEEDDKILDVFQKGYKLKDKVIRPARVKVSKKVQSEKTEDNRYREPGNSETQSSDTED